MESHGSIHVYSVSRDTGLEYELYRTQPFDQTANLGYRCSQARARALFEAEVLLIKQGA